MPDYALYGLVVRSDVSLPGVPEARPDSFVDVRITLGAGVPLQEEPEGATVYQLGGAHGQEGNDVRRDVHGNFWFRYADGTRFVMNAAATEIRAWWPAPSTLEDTATYLLGPVLGFLLRRRGILALHASAVLLDGRAVALVGPSGAGKSTTAAAFAAAGDAVLADDVVALRVIDGVPMAHAAYQLLRLWNESERIVLGTSGELPRITPTWDKRALPLGAEFPFHAEPAPLGDLFVLADRTEDPRAPYADVLGAGEGMMAILANTYANYLLDDALRADELRALGAVLRGRRVFRLVPHADPARIGALLACIRETVRPSGTGT